MKKFAFYLGLSALIFTQGFAEEIFSKNYENTLKNIVKNVEKIEIMSVDRLESIDGLNFVITDINGEMVPMFVSKDGKSIIGFSNLVFIGNNKDKTLIEGRMDKLHADIKANQDKIAYEIIKEIPKDRFINIESFDKNNKFMTYIVSDPECPDCREHLTKMVKYLRNANVRIIFAPVHGKSAYTKSAIMLKEASKINPDNQEALIKLLNKYYDVNATVSDDQASDEERDKVLQDAKKLFSKGVIKGVPFSFTVEKE